MNDLITDNKLLASLLLVVVAIVIRWMAARYIIKIASNEDDLPNRWMNVIRNVMTILIVIGLIIIWLSELRFVALSIATFTVALIIATREIIQCFLGSVYKASTRPFSIGDWIKIGDHCGKVISSDWLTTKLLEVDIQSAAYNYTGKTITIPNNLFITNPVCNFNFMRLCVLHTFTITRDAQPIDLFQAKTLILEKAKTYCEPFKDIVQNHRNLFEKRLGIRLSDPDASVKVATSNLGKDLFTVSILCPTQEADNLEQKLTEEFMIFWRTALDRIETQA